MRGSRIQRWCLLSPHLEHVSPLYCEGPPSDLGFHSLHFLNGEPLCAWCCLHLCLYALLGVGTLWYWCLNWWISAVPLSLPVKCWTAALLDLSVMAITFAQFKLAFSQIHFCMRPSWLWRLKTKASHDRVFLMSVGQSCGNAIWLWLNIFS